MDDLFLTDKCVLLIYPRGASGKFLSNCLALNPAFVLQHNEYINDPTMAFKFLRNTITRLALSGSRRWDDLGLGDREFFGIPSFGDWDASVDEHQQALLESPSQDKIRKIIQDQKHFFRVCHGIESYQFYSQMWPNSKRIYLTDYSDWIRSRNSGYYSANNFNPTTVIDLEQIGSPCHVFSCKSFADSDAFWQEYQALLDGFNLPDRNMNKEMVKEFFDIYMRLILRSR